MAEDPLSAAIVLVSSGTAPAMRSCCAASRAPWRARFATCWRPASRVAAVRWGEFDAARPLFFEAVWAGVGRLP